MPGDGLAEVRPNVRALLAFMWTHPGQETIFMGMEFGQRAEWNVWGIFEWESAPVRSPSGPVEPGRWDLQTAFYRAEPALWRDDFVQFGFQWIDCSDSRHSVISFMRRKERRRPAVGGWWPNFCLQCARPLPHRCSLEGFMPVFNTDGSRYGGSNLG